MKNIKFIGTIVGVCLLIVGCGQEEEVKPLPVDENPIVTWYSNPIEQDSAPGTVIDEGDLGSHSITVSVPEVESDLQQMMERQGFSCVEVYYRRNEKSRLEPAFAGEPESSAVYYFYPRAGEGDEVRAIWNDTAHETSLCWGTHLTVPQFAVKIVVLGADGDPGAVQAMYFENSLSSEGSWKTNVGEATFSESSLKIDPKTWVTL